MPLVSATSEQRYVPFQSARLRTQQPTRGEALLLVLVIMAAVVASAAGTATWANSSIRLQIIDEFVGQWAPHEPQHRLVGAIPAAASRCATTQRATFADEFASLSQRLAAPSGNRSNVATLIPQPGMYFSRRPPA